MVGVEEGIGMLGEIRGEVRFKEPLAFHTSLRVGGPADIFVLPQDVDDVRKALIYAEKEKLPVIVLGGGNNVLVKDRGIRGIVIKLEGCLGRMEFHGEEVTIGGGAGLSTMIREAAALGLGGVEALVGIPATIGGALAMNAGIHDGAIGDFVSAVYFLYADGTIGELKPAMGTFAYRTFSFPPGSILLGARVTLHRKPQKEIYADIKARLKHKKATQPLALASAGCVWKNPGADFAGKLIEKAGLKGKRVGAAEISAKHANFIVNRGGATAADIVALMEMAFERVFKQTGTKLEPEIRILGD
jgi:UDP-N-acetylmuramate dehydrogenase